mmetsp:Transcript_41778/g.110154  ORF Transcript_41778/g.110154 Transcript_41778/m.110154 type:complete len:85 (+) Transcript_41778:1435-1689(+)
MVGTRRAKIRRWETHWWDPTRMLKIHPSLSGTGCHVHGVLLVRNSVDLWLRIAAYTSTGNKVHKHGCSSTQITVHGFATIMHDH